MLRLRDWHDARKGPQAKGYRCRCTQEAEKGKEMDTFMKIPEDTQICSLIVL